MPYVQEKFNPRRVRYLNGLLASTGMDRRRRYLSGLLAQGDTGIEPTIDLIPTGDSSTFIPPFNPSLETPIPYLPVTPPTFPSSPASIVPGSSGPMNVAPPTVPAPLIPKLPAPAGTTLITTPGGVVQAVPSSALNLSSMFAGSTFGISNATLALIAGGVVLFSVLSKKGRR